MVGIKCHFYIDVHTIRRNNGTMIPRLIQEKVIASLQRNDKIHLIFGPRQSGKTTILKDVAGIMEKNGLATLYLNCDIEENLSQLDTSSLTKLSTLFQKSQLIFIDEAQNLSNPGLTLKIIHDNLPNIKIVATGSSSFKLKNSVSDALTGRYFDFLLYPLSFREAASSLTLSNNEAIKKSQFDAILSSILTYGLYPEVYLEPINGQKEALL